MRLHSQCTCGEWSPAELRNNGEICANCLSIKTNPQRQEMKCSKCGQFAPFEMHHIHVSDIVRPLCLNCHAKKHRHQKRDSAI
jgi:hypothetical protein